MVTWKKTLTDFVLMEAYDDSWKDDFQDFLHETPGCWSDGKNSRKPDFADHLKEKGLYQL